MCRVSRCWLLLQLQLPPGALPVAAWLQLAAAHPHHVRCGTKNTVLRNQKHGFAEPKNERLSTKAFLPSEGKPIVCQDRLGTRRPSNQNIGGQNERQLSERVFGYVFAAPLLLWTLPAYFLVAESPRWLLVKHGVGAANDALRVVARKNGKLVPRVCPPPPPPAAAPPPPPVPVPVPVPSSSFFFSSCSCSSSSSC